MQNKLSRRKLALYVTNAVRNGRVPQQALSEVAAYLVDTGRTRETELLARAIEDELADQGIVVAIVTSARPLDETLRTAIKQQIDATTVELKEVVDPAVLGGVRVDMPGQRLDATLARKLTMLRSAKQ